MKKKLSPSSSTLQVSTEAAELRKRAEDQYNRSQSAGTTFPQNETDLQRLVHELQVHQIELEMQNEELLRARAEIEAGLERYTDLYDFAPIGYFALGRDGTIRQVNLRGSHLLGVERARLVGRRFEPFVVKDRSPSFTAFLEQVFASKIRQACEMRVQKEGSEPTWVQIEAAVVTDGQECRMMVLDIQARKLAEMKLQHLSMHDALTGLYNRSYFMESLVRLEQGRQYPISILMADVNHLKLVNDQQGHAAGDTMLKRVAQVLNQIFRIDDVIARIGGDEFAVLLPGTDVQAAEEILYRFHEVFEEHNQIYFTENPLSISVGISTAAEHGMSLTETLKEADEKMYKDKHG